MLVLMFLESLGRQGPFLIRSSATVILLSLVVVVSRVWAEFYLVDTLEGITFTNGNCSITEAIRAANDDGTMDNCVRLKGPTPDVIILGVNGVIAMESAPIITDAVDILGTGSSNLTIDGQGSPIFEMDAVDHFGLSQVRLENGRSMFISGGAVSVFLNDLGTVVLDDVLFRNNSAVEGGGAVGISRNGPDRIDRVDITDCQFLGNSAGQGGAIEIEGGGSGSGTVRIDRTAFVGNTSSFGGGAIFARVTSLEIQNSTFVGNGATEGGGLLVLEGALEVRASTFLRNTATTTGMGAGIQNESGIFSLFNHVVIADSLSGQDCLLDQVTVSSFTLDSDNTCGLADPTDLPMTNSMMTGVGDFGGGTLVALPSINSPLIDAGSSACGDLDGSPLIQDQRGLIRPADGDGNGTAICDPGAAEAQVGFSLLLADQFESGDTTAWDGESP